MQSLNSLVTEGKVLYLGISDAPAWIVSQANEYARQNSLRQFSVYQGQWSAAQRDFERDIIPMCQHEGMALAPWGALGGGYFKVCIRILLWLLAIADRCVRRPKSKENKAAGEISPHTPLLHTSQSQISLKISRKQRTPL
jgi:diketogulonate reductase-like aldo/keto reductase